MVDTIGAATAMHNICIKQDDIGEYFDIDIAPQGVIVPYVDNDFERQRGIIRRNALVRRFERR